MNEDRASFATSRVSFAALSRLFRALSRLFRGSFATSCSNHILNFACFARVSHVFHIRFAHFRAVKLRNITVVHRGLPLEYNSGFGGGPSPNPKRVSTPDPGPARKGYICICICIL